MRRAVLSPAAIFLLAALSQRAAADPGIEFFEKKVRPILVERCYECHSTAAKKDRGGLVLDTKEGMLKGGDTGPAVVPGKPNESLLIKAVSYHDPDFRMPPKGKLPAEAIADLEKWVALGAPDPRSAGAVTAKKYGPSVEEGRKFWAFQAPRRHALPMVKDSTWPRGAIDWYVLAGLERKGLTPAPDADRATLLRRVYFALVGLPPSPRAMDEFLSDRAPDAFERVVDRLLASPQFGEKWARHWLDVARYSDSSGGGRSLLFRDAWRYRDYVIHALNTDKAFDQFVLEQLAGDLLTAATPEERYWQLVATAFLLLGPTNFERQDKPVLEMDIIDEQLDTVGRAFLGMTLGCARCHDHKFDPIPTKDYYALAGIFKSTKFIVHDNVSKWMERPLPAPPDQELAVKAHEDAVAALRQKLQQARAAEKKAGKAVTVAKEAIDPRTLPGIVLDDTQAKKVGNWNHSTFTGHFVGKGYLYDDRGMKGEKSLTFVPEFPRSGVYEVRLAYVAHTNRASKVPVRIFHADGEQTVFVDQRKPGPIDGLFVSLGQFRFEKGDQWFVMVSTDGANGHVVADAVQFLPEDAEAKQPAAPPKGSVKQAPETTDSRALEAELKRLIATGPKRPTAMAVSDGEKIEDCHICVRGNYHNRGPKAPRGFLQVLTPPGQTVSIPPGESGRRQLAEWVVRSNNALTARVQVNRVWHHLFGAGLVRTVDNFGATGETPSHPELLDHLALRFVEQGWSLKKLIREVVLSRAWQMSAESPVAKEALQVDPDNRLLWHANRRRLDAEAIRDSILTASGRLDQRGGGPSIRAGNVLERDYQFDDTRRSVYTPVFRNRLLELFEVFDFADPNLSVGRRNVSTVATQALYLMNSPFVLEEARHLGRRLMDGAKDDAGRVDLGYRLTVGRLPTQRERGLALAFVREAGGGAAAWEQFAQTLFACIDFRYVN